MLKKLVLFLCCLFLIGADYLGQKQLERSKNFMGTAFQITVFDSGLTKERLSFVVDNAFNKIGLIYDQMSSLKEGNLVSKINQAKAGDSFQLDEDTLYVLKESLRVEQVAEGAFDITDRPIKKIWLEAKQKGEPPSKQAIDSALPNVGTQFLDLNSETKILTIKKQGVEIDVDDVARGYATEQAARILKENGVKSAVIHAGGSLRLLGLSSEGRSWKLGIEHPRRIDDYAVVLELVDEAAIATTGDYDNFFLFQDKRLPIVIHPKTGFPSENRVASATVIAENSAFANILSKVFFILGPDRSFEIIDRLKEEKIQAVFIEEKMPGQFTISCSEGIQTSLTDIDL